MIILFLLDLFIQKKDNIVLFPKTDIIKIYSYSFWQVLRLNKHHFENKFSRDVFCEISKDFNLFKLNIHETH